MPLVAFYTLGCKLNYAETATFARQFSGLGVAQTTLKGNPDIVVVNSCAVTEHAQRKCRQLLHRVAREHPEAMRVLVGCYAQLEGSALQEKGMVELVVKQEQKGELARKALEMYTAKANEIESLPDCSSKEENAFFSAYSLGGRTRAFLKVQDGCNYRCTYCTIPIARGASRSDSIENVVKQAEHIAARGTQEIVLTGVNTGSFGRDIGVSFLELLERLDAIPQLSRIRISSIEPNLLSDSILKFTAQSRCFLPHFHLPLQSGSAEILRRMGRRYTPTLYEERVEKTRTILGDPFLGVDVIVGFPGEQNEHFEETYALLERVSPAFLHIFPFSPRPGTPAATMPNKVPSEQVQQRVARLGELSEQLHRTYALRHEHTTKRVLVERVNKEGMAVGFTENYIKTNFPAKEAKAGQIVPVRLTDKYHNGVLTAENAVPCPQM